MANLTFVFVHGLSGWGSYDKQYRRMPYWGMRGGDLMPYLRKKGFDCYAASVAPTGSAWDRACELYAQIAGTRVDYGVAHANEFCHQRFGRDFSQEPLIPTWDDDTRLVLLGHSFGGTTVRLFLELLAHGSEEERAATNPAELSPLFAGGLAHRVHSLVTLASPINGTTAYDLFEDPSFDADALRVPAWSKVAAAMMSRGTAPKLDLRDLRDYANYDMHVDNAHALNETISTLPGVYYFSVPCSATALQPDGTHAPKPGVDLEPLFVQRAHQLGAYKGTSAGGIELDERWRENDGLVNTYSARAPHNAPTRDLVDGHPLPGYYNVLPTIEGDHMWLQGGLTHVHNIRPFYTNLLSMISTLA